MWYAAHLVLSIKFLDGVQDIHPVWEEIYIFETESSDEAYNQADKIGQRIEQADSDSHTYGGRPARWKYEGVRRLAECIDFGGGPPQSGREVTYLYYYLKNEKDIDRILSSQSAELLLDGEDIT